jgi:hypothetical protein
MIGDEVEDRAGREAGGVEDDGWWCDGGAYEGEVVGGELGQGRRKRVGTGSEVDRDLGEWTGIGSIKGGNEFGRVGDIDGYGTGSARTGGRR